MRGTNHWTPEEQQTMCELYPSLGSVGVAPLLPNRTIAAIRLMAFKLGLTMDPEAKAKQLAQRPRSRRDDPTPDEIRERAAEIRRENEREYGGEEVRRYRVADAFRELAGREGA